MRHVEPMGLASTAAALLCWAGIFAKACFVTEKQTEKSTKKSVDDPLSFALSIAGGDNRISVVVVSALPV